MMAARVNHMLNFLKENNFEQYNGVERIQHYIEKDMVVLDKPKRMWEYFTYPQFKRRYMKDANVEI